MGAPGGAAGPLLVLNILGSVVHETKPPEGVNLALKGIASSDSIASNGSVTGLAAKAIDGIRVSDFFKGHCSLTNGLNNPTWWKVDLKKSYKISSVFVTNRDDCCTERLLHAEIRIGNNPDHNHNPICAEVKTVASSNIGFCCGGMEGRYVSVSVPRKEQLSLCEVEVYGDLKKVLHCA
ncbi:fucolectin-like [Engystomops pustulosus]|uniref:fucolectin-like n=1 Tax=Engystomops pustulosus TaxID=76066 RepID=UPI003AFB32B8